MVTTFITFIIFYLIKQVIVFIINRYVKPYVNNKFLEFIIDMTLAMF